MSRHVRSIQKRPILLDKEAGNQEMGNKLHDGELFLVYLTADLRHVLKLTVEIRDGNRKLTQEEGF